MKIPPDELGGYEEIRVNLTTADISMQPSAGLPPSHGDMAPSFHESTPHVPKRVQIRRCHLPARVENEEYLRRTRFTDGDARRRCNGRTLAREKAGNDPNSAALDRWVPPTKARWCRRFRHPVGLLDERAQNRKPALPLARSPYRQPLTRILHPSLSRTWVTFHHSRRRPRVPHQ